jgi:3-hydroxymyristoyl/3-hydroxydecanoyl-(acyl carrier protein) dehydratase/acyl carrier protein
MNQDTRQRVVEILRRDLKLGPDIPIVDNMPLFNSEADLDSLDMLLLVSSIEREFGFRIPSEAVGETVFRSVETLTAYVEANRKGGATAPAPAPAVIPDPLDRLPHGDPFRFVTKLSQLKSDDSAEGVWVVTGKEAFFAGHFSGHPLVPGVLIAEALAQVSGLIAPPATSTGTGKLVHVDVRFEKPVIPPAEIVLQSKLVRKVVSLQQFEVSASVGGIVVARGTLALQLTP